MTGFAAQYDLSKRNISFDFYAWQAHAVILGATEIVFRMSDGYGKHKQTKRELKARYRSIIAPGPAMLGLPCREGDDGIECAATHKLYGILWTRKYDFPRLRSVLPPGRARYTVTMRNVPIHKERNSSPMWRKFAEKIGAALIEDHADKPIGLHERMALYAGAKMNFGVVNGPMGMLMLSQYPMMMCGCEIAEYAWNKHGVAHGDQLPWFLPGQSLMWTIPTLDDLLRIVDGIERASC
jgi:hypothetical protein